MRLLICGGIDFDDFDQLSREIDRLLSYDCFYDGNGLVILTGDAPGADALARRWAKEKVVDVQTFGADWERRGRRAGSECNRRKIEEGRPDVVLAFWDGESRGTLDTIRRAVRVGVPVVVSPYSTKIDETP